MAKIIMIRGNSGSGKSTVAKALQQKLGYGTMLISQDVVRREMIYVKDGPDNKAIPLLQNLVLYARENCDIAILEGILTADKYEKLFTLIGEIFSDHIYAYYYELPFEETLKRHAHKSIANEYGEAEMRRWWKDKDHLPNIPEKILSKEMRVEDIVERICHDIQGS